MTTIEIDTLASMSLEQLRSAWRERFRSFPPAYQSRVLLQHAFAYRLQARQHGELKPENKRRLKLLAGKYAADPRYVAAAPEALKAGAMLIRDWNGKRYGVTVTDGGFLFEGITYTSLSRVAQVITGAKRSGRLFFKLTTEDASANL